MAENSPSAPRGANLLLLVGVIALVGAIYFVVTTGQETPTAVVQPAPEAEVEDVAQAPEPTVTEDAATPEVVENDAEPAPDQDETEEVAETTVEPEQAEDAGVAPSFDLVRIDPEGNAVIAGQAAPGEAVRLLADGDVVAEAEADASGKFVALFDLPPSETPRSLSAETDGANGEAVASAGTVLVAPTRPAEAAEPEPEVAAAPEPAASEPESTAEVAQEEVAQEEIEIASVSPEAQSSAAADDDIPQGSETAEVQTQEPEATTPEEDAEPSQSVAEVAVETPAVPDTPAVVLADEDGVKVLQGASRPSVEADGSPDVVANLVIDTITYDAEGEVALGGRGAAESFARIYVNDRAIQTVEIEPDGSWAAPLPDIDAGVYRLRIDEVTADGTVTSRVETPFQREEPELAAEAIQRPNAVTVQEGFTLWAIAKDRFGSGIEYVRVYEANRELIRDPDLIYPGQVFELPEG